MRDDRARSDEATLAESDAANYGCIRADSYSFFDPGFNWDPVRVAAARSEIVGKNSVWTKKDVICYVHVLPHADSVFNCDVVADCDSTLDKSVIADVAMGTYADVLQDMSKRPDARAFANRICFDQRFFVDERSFFHSMTIIDRIYRFFQDKHVNPAKIM